MRRRGGLFSYAAYAALSGPLGAAIAALLTGTSLLGLAAIIAAGLWWIYRHTRGQDYGAAQRSTEQILAALVQGELAQKIRSNPRESALAALTAGLVLGASAEARKTAADLVRSFSETGESKD